MRSGGFFYFPRFPEGVVSPLPGSWPNGGQQKMTAGKTLALDKENVDGDTMNRAAIFCI
jgi:hypothetical protein